MRRTALAASPATAFVAAVLLAACEGGPEEAASTTTTTTAAPVTSTVTPAPPPPTATSTQVRGLVAGESKVSIKGIGPVLVGMTVDEARRAADVRLVALGPEDPACSYVRPAGAPEGLAFMVTQGTIARVDVETTAFTTRAGVGVGSTEGEVLAAYPGQIEREPHQYVQGSYLIYKAKEAADRGYSIVFETDGTRVTRFRAGRLPEALYVEGCA